MSEIEQLTLEIRQFAELRDWAQFHTLRNLVLALAGEVGELAAEIQWVHDDQIHAHLADGKNKIRFESEIADVATYLLRIADLAEIDLVSAVRNKMLLNETRYPVEKSKGSASKYTEWSE